MTERILFWNACGGLASKINTLQTMIDSLRPLALFIAEAEITPINLSWFKIPDYELITPKVITHGKARLACFLKSTSGLTFKPDLITRDTVEAIVIEDHRSRIVGIYRPFALLESQTKSSAKYRPTRGSSG